MKGPGNVEGLPLARLLMVLSSFAPLFVLLAIRGIEPIPDLYLAPSFALLAVVPTLYLWCWVRRARTTPRDGQADARMAPSLTGFERTVGRAEEHRHQVLAYLFATLLPFYQSDLTSARDVVALVVALALVLFLFLRLNLHYLNLWFVARGYRVYTVFPPDSDNPLSGKPPFVLITRRPHLPQGLTVGTLRLSNSVYLEKDT